MTEKLNNMTDTEKYSSLYDFRGSSSRNTGLGKEVNKAAKAKGIKIIYESLPESLQTEEYRHVATYPVTFLESYFGTQEAADPIITSSSNDSVKDILRRLNILEQQISKLTDQQDYNTATIIDNDDLPF